ncbi:MAG TPA: PEP-CTERM sorting domain-containing protein [Terriglobia bacterium]|jgi:hypothetical protein
MLKTRLTVLMFLAGILSVMVIPLPANADPLMPGSSGTPDIFSLGGYFSGTVLNTFSTQGVTTFTSGNVTTDSTYFEIIGEAVSDPNNVFCNGCVDFMLQVYNERGSAADITMINWAGFGGYKTDVGYDILSGRGGNECGPQDEGECQGDYIPGRVSSTGDVITFDMFTRPPDTTTGIVPNEATPDLVVEVDSRNFTDPSFTVVSSDNATGTISVFGPSGPPVSAVPEPSSLVLLSGGILALATRRKHVRR